MSRISIIAPGIWHADEVTRALVELGHTVEIVGAARRHRVVKPVLRGVRAFAGKAPIFAAPIHMGIGAAARLIDTRQTDLAICWSSFAFASLVQRDIPVVVVRGSTHICTQRERLDDGPRWRRPSLQMVALEEAGRNGVRKADGIDAAAVDGALRSLDVDDDADDFKLVGCQRRQIGEGEDLLGVGHLRDGL